MDVISLDASMHLLAQAVRKAFQTGIYSIEIGQVIQDLVAIAINQLVQMVLDGDNIDKIAMFIQLAALKEYFNLVVVGMRPVFRSPITAD